MSIGNTSCCNYIGFKFQIIRIIGVGTPLVYRSYYNIIFQIRKKINYKIKLYCYSLE